jgi:hypothetical protein
MVNDETSEVDAKSTCDREILNVDRFSKDKK